MMHPLFTIGHSDHDHQHFIDLLKAHSIQAVADVRSSPFSRRLPQFNQTSLRDSLRQSGIKYVFLGRELGARRSEPECYVDGQAQYDRIANLPVFKDGLQRLIEGASLMRVALLCAEKEPLECHRCILVCRHLKTMVPDIRHILGDGSLENHEQTEERLLREFGLVSTDLFHSKAEMLDAAYDRQGKRIAYKEETVLQP